MKIFRFFILLLLFLIINCNWRDRERWDDNRKNWSELMLAIYRNNDNKVEQLINNVDILYNAGGSFNLTAMSVAIFSENEKAVYQLLNSGKIDNLNKYLNLACNVSNNIQIIKYLCEFGADVNYLDENGYNSIMYATSFCSIEILNYLIEQNVDVNIGRQKNTGTTALMLAIYNNDIEKMNILLQAGANKNVVTNNGITLYEIADKYIHGLNINEKKNILELFR